MAPPQLAHVFARGTRKSLGDSSQNPREREIGEWKSRDRELSEKAVGYI